MGDRKEMEMEMMMTEKRRTGSSARTQAPNGEFLYKRSRRTPSTESSHYHQQKRPEELQRRRRRSCYHQDPTLPLFPSKATNNTRQRLHYDQLWRLAQLASVVALLCIGSFSGVSATAPEDLIDDAGGVCPMKCACLDSYIQCTKENLATAPSRVPKWAEFLDLSGNRLRENVNESVANLPALKDLRLKRNRLRAIPIFRGLESLDKLTLSHNQIERVSPEAIAALPRLEHLDLSKNLIKVLAASVFPVGNILKVINLDGNIIEDIQRGALNALIELTDLKLKGNHLVSVTAEIFQRMKRLKKLQLNGNRIETVHGLTFKYLAELRVLQLRNNRIRTLQPGAFHGLNNIEKLELDNNKLTNVSKEWLFNLTSLHTLSLSNNSINYVEIDSWDFVHGLHTLELSHNRLEAIDATMLEKLMNLQEFFARNNRIKAIAEAAFRYVPNLQVLDLSHNEISSAIEDLNAPFARLESLRRLDLSANKIRSINQRAFVGLKSVETLDLTGNNVTTIQSNAFTDLVSLKELLFDSPTLLCDCQLQWLHDWLWELRATDRASVLEKLQPVCYYPVWLRGRSLMELGAKNFTCNDSPKPKIIEEPPQTLLALKGTQLNLTCTATTTSRSHMKFQWRRDNAELRPELSKATVLHSPTEFDNSTVISSVLEFDNVNQAHVGNYQCIVSNDYGSTYSMKHKITVGTLPTFKKVPTNLTVNAGETIRLDCAVFGEPRASLAWLKDGGNDFPAARERRMHVMPEDYAFFITNAKVQDSGVYSCCAENMVGVVQTNATIVVLEVPMFLKPLEDKEVLPGTPTVLECMASGSPRPQLKWTKDGHQIEGISDRYYFAADEQLLVIMDSQARDTGVYECEIWNELGSETGRMQLTVIAQNKLAPPPQFDSLSIIIIIAVGCILGTSIIWLVIIYHTKKPAGRRGSPGGGGAATELGLSGRSAINNAAMATMLTVGDAPNCPCDFARTSLLPNGTVGGMNVIAGLHGEDESLYLQQAQNRGLLVSPVRLNRRLTVAEKNELMMLRGQQGGGPEDDARSCKDSGNGDSAERNPTSSDDEEMEEMIELQEQRQRMLNNSNCSSVSIQRNRLNEYLGDEVAEVPQEVNVAVGGNTVLSAVCFGNKGNSSNSFVGSPQKTGERMSCGSTFKGSSGNILMASSGSSSPCNNQNGSSSNSNSNLKRNNVA